MYVAANAVAIIRHACEMCFTDPLDQRASYRKSAPGAGRGLSEYGCTPCCPSAPHDCCWLRYAAQEDTEGVVLRHTADGILDLVLFVLGHCTDLRDLGFRSSSAACALLVVTQGVGDLHVRVCCNGAQCESQRRFRAYDLPGRALFGLLPLWPGQGVGPKRSDPVAQLSQAPVSGPVRESLRPCRCRTKACDVAVSPAARSWPGCQLEVREFVRIVA